MSARIRCPNPDCGKSYTVANDRLAGRGRCKACGQVFELSSSVDARIPPKAKSGDGDPSIPDRLGRFLIRERVGSGAFGTVYRASDPSLEREVALKVPLAGMLDTPKAVERFLREARAAARLRHPHIVPLYETGLDAGRHYIASAYIDGSTLAEIIEPGGLAPKRAAKIVGQLAEALHYAHSEKIVHRDVKPGNVMIDARGDAHLMDFGLARFELSDEKLTQDGAILGTPAYMAPEQATGRGGEANAASDQYSLGVTFYELLCGQTPFSGPPEIVLFQVIGKEPRRLEKINHGVPRDVETICMKAMAKAPKDRYTDCRAFAGDLQRWLEDEPIRARRHGLIEHFWRWAKRNPVGAGLVSAVAFLLVAIAVVAMAAKQNAEAILMQFEKQASIQKRQTTSLNDEKAYSQNLQSELVRVKLEHEYYKKDADATIEKMNRTLIEQREELMVEKSKNEVFLKELKRLGKQLPE